jgi:hypothetical protein
MIAKISRLNGFRLPSWSKKSSSIASMAALFVLASAGSVQAQATQMQGQTQGYDGPQFTQGLWRFERSVEVSSRNSSLPNTSHMRVQPAVVRCVDPTQAMKETFRPASVGSCHSAAPEKSRNTYSFAKRCDHMGPVKTVISVESATAYRETNELLGPMAKKETVVARRIGECGTTPDPQSYASQFDPRDPSSFYAVSSK